MVLGDVSESPADRSPLGLRAGREADGLGRRLSGRQAGRREGVVTEVSYFEVETYGRMAEFCSTQATKGRGVRVVGRLKQDRWKDTDNKNQSKTYIVAEHVEYKPKFQNNSEAGENNGGKSESNVKKETAAPAEAQTSEEQQSEMVEEAVF